MKIAVLGCGAIGGIFLGYLSQEEKDVLGIVKNYQREPLCVDGLILEGARGNLSIKPKIGTHLEEKVDLAIFATKINDLEKIAEDNTKYLKDAIILTTQNGIGAEEVLARYFSKEKVISGIVMFGATFYPPNRIVHNFEGGLILGSIFGQRQPGHINKIKYLLQDVFNITCIDNIIGAKYLKVFVNLNNCIPACLGVSMQEAFSDLNIAKLAIMLNREAYGVVKKSNIDLESLPNYPKERLQGLISMGLDEAAVLFSKTLVSLSKDPLYGSILQSIRRGRKSEIDYINGQIVKLAKENNVPAPLNSKIVSLIHRVEGERHFFSKEALQEELNSNS